MSVASLIVLPQLISDRRDEAGQILFFGLSEAEKAQIRLHDLAVIRDPYVAIGIVVLFMLSIIAITRMPKTQSEEQKALGHMHSAKQTLANLWHNTIYREGVLAQMFYVAAQIMTWTFIIQYADNLGINKATAQMYSTNVQHRSYVAVPMQPIHINIPHEVRKQPPTACHIRLRSSTLRYRSHIDSGIRRGTARRAAKGRRRRRR